MNSRFFFFFRTALLGTTCAALILTAVVSLKGQSQSEMNQQADQDFQKTDTKLNQVYKKLMAILGDDVAKKKLVDTQRAWIAFRDAEADFAADQARGGSMAPLLYSTSETATTNQRIAELQDYIRELGTR